jgi:hypothetical protein
MTDDPELSFILDRWLSDGPTEMPDRVIDVVAIGISRQRQRPAWRLDRRLPRMNTSIKIAAAALVALLTVSVVGYNLLPGDRPGVGGPPPTSSPTASAAPSPTASPPALTEGRLTDGDYIVRAFAGDRMAFTVTAPERWSGYGGWGVYGPASGTAPNGIGIAFLHGAQVVSDPCAIGASEPSPAPSPPSVDDVVASLSARQDLQASGVTDVTLAGYSGKRIDLQLPAVLGCGAHYVFAEPQGLYAQGPSNRWRVWALDADGETATIVLMDYGGTPPADRAAAQAIIDSVRISP